MRLAGGEKRIMMYFAQETRQLWGKPGPVGGEDGVALWLPGSILLELRMVPPVRPPPPGCIQTCI